MPKKAKVDTNEETSIFNKDNKTRAYLHSLAHRGNEKSIKDLKEFIKKEKDYDTKIFAELALQEAQFFYYSPNNKQEEKDFELKKMVVNKQGRRLKLQDKATVARNELSRLDIEREINEKIEKNHKKRDWKELGFGFSEDYYITVKNNLLEIELEIKYLDAWIEQGTKSIKNKKFLEMPEEALKHMYEDCDLDDDIDIGCPF